MRAAAVTLFALIAATGGLEAQSAGQKVFQGKGLCHACHGKDARGTPLAPNLTDNEWINVDGSLPAIVALIRTGVPKPVRHPAPMPPMGGAKLSKGEIDAVAAYVKSLSSDRSTIR
ncbi:MAG: cytochrome c [Gemmatimonadetes bacterium]|nr:cytochrome c [Gemmatimonadota bacterium]